MSYSYLLVFCSGTCYYIIRICCIRSLFVTFIVGTLRRHTQTVGMFHRHCDFCRRYFEEVLCSYFSVALQLATSFYLYYVISFHLCGDPGILPVPVIQYYETTHLLEKEQSFCFLFFASLYYWRWFIKTRLLHQTENELSLQSSKIEFFKPFEFGPFTNWTIN